MENQGQPNENTNIEADSMQDENYSENSQEQLTELEQPNFPSDYSDFDQNSEVSQEVSPPAQESEENDPRSNYLESLLHDQQEFVNSLESAENQLMLDENFILLISNISNKNSERMFDLDYRDEQLQGENSIPDGDFGS